MSTLVLVEFQAKTESVAEVLALFGKILGDTRAFDGCQSVVVHQGDEDASQFVLVEQWASREHYQRYFAWREKAGFVDKVGPMLVGPPTIRYFDPLTL